jgi:hypothetical protein
MNGTYPHYQLRARTITKMMASFLTGQKRRFREDAICLSQAILPSPCVLGQIPGPPPGGMLVLVNHYTRRGFQAWWIAVAISSVLPFDLHWVVTSGWEYEDYLRSKTITPISRYLLRKIAFTYGFTSMPAMPPRPEDTEKRAIAVRKLLRYARSTDQPLIGLAPEGYDSLSGQLQSPPEGAGRLLGHLTRAGLMWQPVGIYEQEGLLNLRFGPLTEPDFPERAHPNLDSVISRQAMYAIAACLPERLRGPYRQSRGVV